MPSLAEQVALAVLFEPTASCASSSLGATSVATAVADTSLKRAINSGRLSPLRHALTNHAKDATPSVLADARRLRERLRYRAKRAAKQHRRIGPSASRPAADDDDLLLMGDDDDATTIVTSTSSSSLAAQAAEPDEENDEQAEEEEEEEVLENAEEQNLPGAFDVEAEAQRLIAKIAHDPDAWLDLRARLDGHFRGANHHHPNALHPQQSNSSGEEEEAVAAAAHEGEELLPHVVIEGGEARGRSATASPFPHHPRTGIIKTRRVGRVSRESSREVGQRIRTKTTITFSSEFAYAVWRHRADWGETPHLDRATANGGAVSEPSPVKDADSYPSLKMRYQVMRHVLSDAETDEHGRGVFRQGNVPSALLRLGGRDAENALHGGWGSRNLAGISSRDVLARRHKAHTPTSIREEQQEEERANWWQAGDSRGSDKENATTAALAALERPVKAAKLLLGREALSSRRCYPYP